MNKILLSALTCLLLTTSCKKDDPSQPMMQLSGTMSGSNTVPAVTSSGSGAVSGTYDPNTKLLTYSVAYAGITPTAGHFHLGAAGATGPVAVTFNDVSKSPITGSYTLTQDQANALIAGTMYANLHTAAHPDGEIRANVTTK